MGFFDRYLAELPPPAEPSRQKRPAWARPEDVLPAIVAADLILARTNDVAVAVPVLRAYPSGFAFQLAIRLRVPDDDGQLSWAMHPSPRGGSVDEAFRLAVVYADGRAASTIDRYRHPTEPGHELMLSPEDGGGGGRSWDMNFWVHPLPPPGPLAFICEWPARAVPESRAEIEAQRLLEASTRAIPLWPKEALP